MNKKLYLTFAAILAALLCSLSYACSVPKPGANYPIEQLIDESKNIQIVELSHSEKVKYGVIHYLKPVKVIKGNMEGLIEFYGHEEKHEPSSYDDHNIAAFWFSDIGRSAWPCCICGPDHTFAKGFKYLIFPDLMGARKTAEIIRNENDRWYKFVVNRVNKNSIN